MILSKPLYISLTILTGLLLTSCQQVDFIVHEKKLANGMTVLVKEDHRAPVVVSQIWYHVGSSYEPPGQTGLSHVLEHMMFKATDKLESGEASRIIAENGGRENAFTGHDFTAYYQQLEKSRLPISFEIESDRMRSLKFDPDEFAKEIKIVMEERRLRTDDRPYAQLFEKFMATAHPDEPYGHPIIGWPQDLKSLTLAQAKDWYDRWYHPNNATLVVVGDVEPTEVFKLAKQYFGDIPAQDVQPEVEVNLDTQREPRRIEVGIPAKLPYIVIGYKAPSLSQTETAPDCYALYVLAGLLDGGNSARIPRSLIRERKLATQAGASYDPVSLWPTLFIVDGTPAEDTGITTIEAALLEQIELVKTQPIPDEELEKVKAQVMAKIIYEQDSIFYQAMQLGKFATTGIHWRRYKKHIAGIEAVTAEQVQAVAKKYLIDRNRTTAILDPLPLNNNVMKTHAH